MPRGWPLPIIDQVEHTRRTGIAKYSLTSLVGIGLPELADICVELGKNKEYMMPRIEPGHRGPYVERKITHADD